MMKRALSKIIILVIMGAVIIFLIAQDFVWSGQLSVQTDFLKFTPYFSVLKPQVNIVRQNDANYIQAEPVYFDLYLPRDFKEVKIELKYKDEYGYQLYLGPNLKTVSPNGVAGWDLKPITELPSAGNDYKIKSVDFDLTKANINNGKLRFQLSVPDLKDPAQGIYLKNVRLDLTRPAIWQENFVQNLINYFTYVKNQF